MEIITELKEKVLRQDSDFLPKLASRWYEVNSRFFKYYAGKNPEPFFLSLLLEEVHRKLPNYEAFVAVKLNGIPPLQVEAGVEKVLGMQLSEIRKQLCMPGWLNRPCKSNKCFEGTYPSGTEIDALLANDRGFCLIEYEDKPTELCDNFMKMYRLRKLFGERFESLFVTRLSTVKQPNNLTSLEKSDAYINQIKMILDRLLEENWAVLGIVDLSRKIRSFNWRP